MNTFSTEHIQTTASEFLEKDIDKFNVRQTKVQKNSFTEKTRKACNRGKRTQMPVTVTEGLPAVFAGELSQMFDGILNEALHEKVSTTGVTQENLDVPLPPNSLDSHQTQTNKIKFWAGPTL